MITARSNGVLLKRKPLKALVCLITLVAFLFNSVSYDITWAVGTPSELPGGGADRAGGSGLFKELQVDTFILPEYLGHIKDSWKGRGADRVVIHIQDAHCNYAAQHKINEIIEYLSKEYGINTVNLEGGVKDYDLSIFTDIKDKVIREKTADYFVREGLVSGAEYFAINNPERTTLWGIEDTKLYIDNLKVYRDSLKYKDEVDKHLNSLTHILNNLKIKMYSQELLDLDTKYSQYKSGSLEFKDYLAYIIRIAKIKSIDVKGLSDIYLLSQTLTEEGNIDFKKANRQRNDLIDKLQKKLSKKSLEELVLKTIEFKSEKISQKDFYAYLAGRASLVNIELSDFPDLQKYITYISMYNAIDKMKMMEEMEILESKLKDTLYRNDKQKELNKLSENLAILKNIFNISLTKDDYKYYTDNESSFSVSNYTSFINKEIPLHKITAQLDTNIADLDRHRESISKFYKYSFSRDNVFLKNIKFNQKQKTAAIVTGGFHTDNLCEIFKNQNIAYISIMPNFKNCDEDKCHYFELLSGKPNPTYGKIASVLGNSLAIATFLSSDREFDSLTQNGQNKLVLALLAKWREAVTGDKYDGIEIAANGNKDLTLNAAGDTVENASGLKNPLKINLTINLRDSTYSITPQPSPVAVALPASGAVSLDSWERIIPVIQDKIDKGIEIKVLVDLDNTVFKPRGYIASELEKEEAIASLIASGKTEDDAKKIVYVRGNLDEKRMVMHGFFETAGGLDVEKLKTLKAKGVKFIAVTARPDKDGMREHVNSMLESVDMYQIFDDDEDIILTNGYENKVAEIGSLINNREYAPAEMVFVDDYPKNTKAVIGAFPGISTIQLQEEDPNHGRWSWETYLDKAKAEETQNKTHAFEYLLNAYAMAPEAEVIKVLDLAQQLLAGADADADYEKFKEQLGEGAQNLRNIVQRQSASEATPDAAAAPTVPALTQVQQQRLDNGTKLLDALVAEQNIKAGTQEKFNIEEYLNTSQSKSKHHLEGTTLRHHLAEMLDLLERADFDLKPLSQKTENELPGLINTAKNNIELLRQAILWHDLGKAAENTRGGHAQKSSELIETYYSGEQEALLKWIVQNHMFMVFFYQTSDDGQQGWDRNRSDDKLERIYEDFLKRSESGELPADAFKLLLIFTLIDRQGSLKEDEITHQLRPHTGNFNELIEWWTKRSLKTVIEKTHLAPAASVASIAGMTDGDGKLTQITCDASTLPEANKNNWSKWMESIHENGLKNLHELYPGAFVDQPSVIAIEVTSKEFNECKAQLYGEKAAGNAFTAKLSDKIEIVIFTPEARSKVAEDLRGKYDKERIAFFVHTTLGTDGKLQKYDTLEAMCYKPLYMVGANATPMAGCVQEGLALLNHSYLENKKKGEEDSGAPVTVTIGDLQASFAQVLNGMKTMSGGEIDQADIDKLVEDATKQGYSLGLISLLVRIRPVDVNSIADFHKAETAVLRAL